MQSFKSEFDYQSIIEACGIQDENKNKAHEGRSEAERSFYEQFETLKTLLKERNEHKEKLEKLKLLREKHLLKLQKSLKRVSDYNKECKIIHEGTAQLNLELQKQSENFVKKIKSMDDELTALYSQFEGETLSNMINNLNSELIVCLDSENQLGRNYEQLENHESDLSTYERLPYLKLMIPCVSEAKKIESERKIANKKRNVQFLVNEYNKKLELLQKFG